MMKFVEIFLLAAFASSVETTNTTIVDWCFEYDELRFLVDTTTISINAWERHSKLIESAITNAQDYVNRKLFDVTMQRLTVKNVGKISNFSSLTDSRVEPLNRLLDHFKRPLKIEKAVIESMFRTVVVQSPRLSRTEAVVLISRMIVGLLEIRNAVKSDLDRFVDQKNDAISSIKTHQSEIEFCLRSQITDAANATVAWTQKLNRIESVMNRFAPVREIIVDAIEMHSATPAVTPLSDETKSLFFESVKSVIFRSSSTRELHKNLTQTLKRNLKQTRWSFLINWLEALDDLERIAKNQYAVLIDTFRQNLATSQTAVLTSQSMLEQLAQDCEPALNTF